MSAERSLHDPGQVADVVVDCLLTPTLDGVFSRVPASRSCSVLAKQPSRPHVSLFMSFRPLFWYVLQGLPQCIFRHIHKLLV